MWWGYTWWEWFMYLWAAGVWILILYAFFTEKSSDPVSEYVDRVADPPVRP